MISLHKIYVDFHNREIYDRHFFKHYFPNINLLRLIFRIMSVVIYYFKIGHHLCYSEKMLFMISLHKIYFHFHNQKIYDRHFLNITSLF